MSDDANYSYGEIPISAGVHSAQRATPEQIVALAKNIWHAVGDSGVSEVDSTGNDALLERLQAEYADFNQSFPLVLRWMVQVRQFNAKALEKYLLMHSAAKLDTREGFLRLQAEYLVLLYRESHRHPDEKFVRRYRESIVNHLLAEDKAFLEIHKQVEDDLEAQAQAINTDRRKRLYEYLLAQKVARERIGALGGSSGPALAAATPVASSGPAPAAATPAAAAAAAAAAATVAPAAVATAAVAPAAVATAAVAPAAVATAAAAPVVVATDDSRSG